jgi:hypothetical protein
MKRERAILAAVGRAQPPTVTALLADLDARMP